MILFTWQTQHMIQLLESAQCGLQLLNAMSIHVLVHAQKANASARFCGCI